MGAAEGGGCLVVGGGPAGLEAAIGLSRRGCRVVLAEAAPETGGRARREGALSGLSALRWVRDWQQARLAAQDGIELRPRRSLGVQDVLAARCRRVVIATGARWRGDGVGRSSARPAMLAPAANVLTPDDLLSGTVPCGHVVLYDDDGSGLGPALAALMVERGATVVLLTTGPMRAAPDGVVLLQGRLLTGVRADAVEARGLATGRHETLVCDAVVMVTARLPADGLHRALLAQRAAWADHGLRSVEVIGDAATPGTVAQAVLAGRRCADEARTG
jgi:dimethylamine/trimethylamine dehydrogenase